METPMPRTEWQARRMEGSSKSDWCPNCGQGWDCAKQDQESRIRLHTLERELAEAHERIENMEAATIHSCGSDCKRPMCVMRRELAEAVEILSKFSTGEPAHLIEADDVMRAEEFLAKHKGGEG